MQHDAGGRYRVPVPVLRHLTTDARRAVKQADVYRRPLTRVDSDPPRTRRLPPDYHLPAWSRRSLRPFGVSSVRRGCVSAATEQGFPKYVWGWLGGDLYEARHINGPAGTYKGYTIEESERPLDPDGRLNRDDGA